jgi:cytochrome c553
MNKLLTALFAMAVASVTLLAHAQAPAKPAQPAVAAQANQKAAAAPETDGAKSIEAKVAQCVGCHGIRGYKSSFPEVYNVPMIAGQSAKYIVAALTAYKQGERKHPTMRSVAGPLSERDMTDIAAYFEALGKDGGAALPAKADKEASPQVEALLKKAACVSCHGNNFATPIAGYPSIAGQHSDYLYVALKSYKSDNNPNVGRSNAVMGAIAKQFSNAELKSLASYVSSLEGPLKTVPEPRFR